MRKTVYIGAICILGLLITTAVLPAVGTMNVCKTSVMGEVKDQHQEKSILSSKLVTPISLNDIPTPKAMEGKEIPLTAKHALRPIDIPVAETEDDEFHPTLAVNDGGGLFGAYTLKRSIIEANVIYTFSENQGETWDESYYEFEGVLDYPAIDYWGSGNTFVGTFLADPSEADGSAQYRLIVKDPNDIETWDLVMWDWTTYNQRDRESPDIAGYDNNGEAPDWYFGVIVDTQSSDNPDYPGEHNPVLNWADYSDENNGWFWIWTFNDSAHACVDIDKSNGMVYAAWDYLNETTGARDILYCVADTHDWMVEDWVADWYNIGGSEENTFPDVAADNGYVYIVSQSDEAGTQDIVCYYSLNGGETWDMSVVAGDSGKDEMYPSIVAYGEGASVTYIVDGDLYITHTGDGGETWSTPEEVNDETGTVIQEYRNADICPGAVVWADDREDNPDVYFETYGDSPAKPSKPNGPSSGKKRTSYTYETVSNDPNGDDISYGWDWDGDDVVDEWTELYSSGQTASISHTWTSNYEGNIKVKAKDSDDHESPWSDPLSVSIPKNKAVTYPLLQKFLEIFPNASPILRYLLKL